MTPETEQFLWLYPGRCKDCGRFIDYASRDTLNPLTHRHIPVTVTFDDVRHFPDAILLTIPPGLKTTPLRRPVHDRWVRRFRRARGFVRWKVLGPLGLWAPPWTDGPQPKRWGSWLT